MEYLAVVDRLLLFVVFSTAVWGKLASAQMRRDFVRSVHTFELVPKKWVRPIAGGVIAVELVTAALMLVPTSKVAVIGFVLAAAILAVFTVGVGWSLIRGKEADCLCFGRSSRTIAPRHLVRNGLLLSVAISGVVAAMAAPDEVELGSAVVPGLAGAAIGLLATRFDELVNLYRPGRAVVGDPRRRTGRP